MAGKGTGPRWNLEFESDTFAPDATIIEIYVSMYVLYFSTIDFSGMQLSGSYFPPSFE